ncbi:hypothetical protein IJ102_00210 [Candidatus Saccharibacteria bacterium]|nr:hypothetical protein [Candidatus Saccharibacteria bacterium]
MPKIQSGYQLEFAVDAQTETTAIQHLADTFGAAIKKQILPAQISRHSKLFFIAHCFRSDQLTDEAYYHLRKNKNVMIVSDELSLRRAKRIFEICLPVEVQLKKILIYVFPVTLQALHGHNDKKTRLQICQQINSRTLGDLLAMLEADFIAKNNTKIWDHLCVVLQEPVAFDEISPQLQALRHLRKKAAHPQLISAQDLADAKAQAAFIMKYIANIRADYDIALKECVQCLAKEISVADIQPALAELVR